MKPTRVRPFALPAAALAAAILVGSCASAPRTQPQQPGQPAPDQPSTAAVAAQAAPAAPAVEPFEERWGIRIVGIRQTSGGYMLDFRFRVLDAKKAAPLFVRQTKPYLIDQQTGAQFQVPNPPKTGPLRNSDPPEAGRVYWMFFANPARYVKVGNRVTVVIGEFRAEDLIVE